MRKVMLAMMTRDKPEVETQFALLNTMREFERAGIQMKLRYSVKDSMVPRSRNQFVADALAWGADDLVMIDDDVVWEDEAVLRLLSHDCDVVGGAYPKRVEPLQYPVKMLPGAPLDQATGLMEVRFLPGGFLRMTRTCLERMVEAYADLKYTDPESPTGHAHGLFWFEIYPDPDTGEPTCWGEDFTFCRRWREIGGQVFCDTLLRFKHIGRKAYEGCYAEDLPAAALFRKAVA